MDYKVVFHEGFEVVITNADSCNAANDIFYMLRNENIIFMAPANTVLCIVQVNADTAEKSGDS